MTEMQQNRENRLKEIYYDPVNPAGLGSVRALAAAAKVSLNKTREWLRKQATYIVTYIVVLH